MYLVDTNVISAASPGRPVPPALAAWMEAQSASLFMSVVTVAEIEDGIAKLRREGATRKSADLAEWLETVMHLYGERILSFDMRAARIAGRLSDRARGLGQAPGFADIIIAATARRHQLTILSRNLGHFEPLDVPVLDPFADLP
ncbi:MULTISPECIES: type II toxin-antitoxin system VapC family toxin [unclassified Bradyrhizobium]|uniref:type II toxin-antitoxin system VapC family toxin n=1 Tax=unclassified Bradyrhizobium TaxID=2631580 RepID=UPI0028E65AA9|nr:MULTISPECIES: type II toxin-antitoxin system VapC family toxin [unclassified Bradyrhizobium]